METNRILVPFLLLLLHGFFLNAQNINFLDPTFGNGGKVVTDVFTAHEWCDDAVIDNEGRIILTGASYENGEGDAVIVRYMPNGTIDSTFGMNGRVAVNFGFPDNDAISVDLQSDQKILIAGNTGENQVKDACVARFSPNGSPDSTFGMMGQVILPAGTGYDVFSDMFVQPDQKIVLVGFTSETNTNSDLLLVRLNPNGELDTLFGQGGIVKTQITSNSEDNGIAAALQPDGKIVVAGQTHPPGVSYRVVLVRYHPDGNIDNTFTTNGQLALGSGVWTGENSAYSIAIQNDGKILIAGESYLTERSILTARFNDDRSIDNTFGQGGIVRTKINTLCYTTSGTLALQPDGKILLSGHVYNSPNSEDIALFRLQQNGMLDSTFGDNGVIMTDIGSSSDYAESLNLQHDGKIVVSGYSRNNLSELDFVMLRYLPELSVGINDFSETETFGCLIYPNPLSETATISFELSGSDNVRIEMMDNNGRILHSFNLGKLKDGKNVQTLEFPANIPNGSYILNLNAGNKKAGIRICLQR